MANVSLAQVNQLRAKLRAAHETVKGKAEAGIQGGLTIGIAGLTAGSFGAAKGKFGPIEVFGTPVELLAAVGVTAVTALGGAGRYSHEAVAVAAGAFCAYTHTIGAALGARITTPAAVLKLKSAVSGVGAALGQGSNQVSTNEVNELVQAAARATGS